MQVDLLPVLLFLLTLVVSVAVTFYIKDYLQKRMEYVKLRKKLEKIAGKHATIVYTGSGPFGAGGQLFKIIDTDEHGITIQNELQTIFIPTAKLLQSEMVLPCENYEQVRIAKMKKDMEQLMDSLMPAMFNKMFPAIKEAFMDSFREDLLEQEGEMSAVIGIKIQKFLSDEGLVIKKRLPEGKDE